MALEQYAVRLTPDEREELSRLIRSGKSSARIVARARTLLLSHAEAQLMHGVQIPLDAADGQTPSSRSVAIRLSRLTPMRCWPRTTPSGSTGGRRGVGKLDNSWRYRRAR